MNGARVGGGVDYVNDVVRGGINVVLHYLDFKSPIPWLVTCRHRDYMILLLPDIWTGIQILVKFTFKKVGKQWSFMV